jgi:hypothetical protein
MNLPLVCFVSSRRGRAQRAEVGVGRLGRQGDHDVNAGRAGQRTRAVDVGED